jgi:iron complex outermembrane receptor protein
VPRRPGADGIAGDFNLITTSARARLLASSMITTVALAASAGGAFAQAAQNTTGNSAAVPTKDTTVQEFVVTGSRIPQPNLTSVSPVTAVSSQELKLEGTTRVEDLINQLPQVVADQGGNLSNGASGTATIDLRGLGAKRNLVLIDGRRLGPGDPGTPVADINFIPASLIDRVDVLTGGASATYGADAVAGVVNFVMKKDFEGLQIDVNAGGYQNGNYDTKAQAANSALGYKPPTSPVFDGRTIDVSLIFGASSPDGKGNVEGYLGYRYISPVTEAARDYSFCAITVSGQNYSCGGSSTSRFATIRTYNAAFASTGRYQVDPTAPKTLDAYTGAANQLYNYAPENYYQRPDERYSGGFFAHYDITPHVTAYSQFMFMDDKSDAQIAESGSFGVTVAVPCNNPLLSAQEVTDICVKPGYTTAANPTGVTAANPAGVSATNTLIYKRNVEGGPRIDDLRHTDYRAIVGLRGDLSSNWHFDVYAQYYTSILSSIQQDYFSNTKLANALDVVPGPNGTAVCAVGGSCVPYNIWTTGGVTQAALNYLEVPGELSGETTEQVVSGAVTGDLSPYGLKSPFAKDGVGVSFGSEYRREYLSTSPDAEEQAGDLAGSGGKTPPIAGGFDVKEVFAEARIPLVEDMPFFKELTANVGYRFSHYSEAGDTSTYKIAGEWAINDDVRIRGGFNHAVRAPNVDELYAVNTIGLDGNADPCSGTTPKYTAAQCANTGVTAAQYGNISANPANQYNGLLGGNKGLKPETADTYTIGAVITPTDIIKGMSFSADYFNIDVTNVIEKAGFANIINDCATTDNATYCSLIHRQAGTGSLWLNPSGYITDTLQNLGYLKTTGIDFAFDYRLSFQDFGLPDYGGLTLNFLGTYTATYTSQGAAGTPTLYCDGKYGVTCGEPQPVFKSKTRLTWSTPIQGLGISVDWRYLGSVNVDTGATGTADSHIPAYNYFDLSTQWRVKSRYTFRVGVTNIFDKDPPIIGGGELTGTFGNGNTFPQIYDALGRYIFMGVTADF